MLTGVKLPDGRGNVNAEDGCNGEAFTENCNTWMENKSEIPSVGIPSTFRSFDMVRPFDKLRDLRPTNRAQDTASSRHRRLRD